MIGLHRAAIPGKQCRDAAASDLARNARRAVPNDRHGAGGDPLYRAVVDSAIDALVVIDGDQIIQIFNRAAEALLGYAAAEAVGHPVALVLPDPIGPTADLYLDPGRCGEAPVWRRTVGRRSDGATVPLEVSAAQWIYRGRPLLTATLRQVDGGAELRQVSKTEMLGRLASGVSHDFNNLLTVIGHMIEVSLETLPDAAEARQPLGVATQAIDRAAGLAGRILAFARHDEARRDRVCLAQIVDEALDLLACAIPNRIAIRRRLAHRGEIAGDSLQLHQLVMNLVLNAADAIGERGGTIGVEIESATAGGAPHACLVICDDGAGMPAEIVARVFDPFFTTKPPGKGTGLGLAVAQEIVAGHGGTIAIDSKPGLGTALTIHLPELPPG